MLGSNTMQLVASFLAMPGFTAGMVTLPATAMRNMF